MHPISWSAAYYLSEWIIRLVMLVYVPNRRSSSAARTWLLLIFLLPWPGLILYAAIGRIYLPRRRLEQQARASQQIRTARFQMRANETWPLNPPEDIVRAARLAANLGDFLPIGGNEIALLTDYEASIVALVVDIEAAKHHVHLLYYIFEDDRTGRLVGDALIRASKRGVKCRVLMDAVGSARGLRRLAPRLRKASIEVHAALPVGIFQRNAPRIDLRNHRKIAVIDGRVGYTGSQNIVEPCFVRDCPNEELVVRITGPVVKELQAVFLADEYFETEAIIEEPELFPEVPLVGGTVAQVLPSGPGYGRENVQTEMVDLIHGASQRVVITTPYFVPDEPFLQAIRTAVLRGVEVHLVLPLKSNQPITRLAQQSYFEELLEAGVRIHLYWPHFLHAKHLSVDDDVALIGSSNIDIRSFALNAEVSLLIYDRGLVARLWEIQQRYFASSILLTAADWGRRSVVSRTVQNVARLADSLL